MQEVKIFMQTGIKSIRPADGAAGYLLEAQTEKGPATLSKIYTIRNTTAHGAELSVLIEAVKRLREPCSLTIFNCCQLNCHLLTLCRPNKTGQLSRLDLALQHLERLMS